MLSDARRTATLLGALGVLPFVALAAAVAIGGDPWHDRAAFALAAYGAGIVSFLGAVYWGAAITMPTNRMRPGLFLLLGVVPQLAAWLALLLPVRAALFGLAALVVGLLALDAFAARAGLVPRWWMPLRIALSLAAGVSLATGGVFAR